MAFSLPYFNLLGNVWKGARFPASGAPDIANMPCQKYLTSKTFLDVEPLYPQFWVPPIMVRFSRLSITGPTTTWNLGSFEIPAGSGQYYVARWWEIMHEGFPNEYGVCIAEIINSHGVSFTPPLASS